MKTIIISGHSGSGKDTFANFLCEILKDKRILVIHFADPVKWMAKEFYKWDGNKQSVQGRTLLQHIGTDMMRAYDEDYWCRFIGEFLAVAENNNEYDVVLIPDARFPNEIESIRNYCKDVISVRIERYNNDKSKYINPKLTQDQINHASETALDHYYFDYIIENYSLEGLKDSAQALIEYLTDNFNNDIIKEKE